MSILCTSHARVTYLNSKFKRISNEQLNEGFVLISENISERQT